MHMYVEIRFPRATDQSETVSVRNLDCPQTVLEQGTKASRREKMLGAKGNNTGNVMYMKKEETSRVPSNTLCSLRDLIRYRGFKGSLDSSTIDINSVYMRLHTCTHICNTCT